MLFKLSSGGGLKAEQQKSYPLPLPPPPESGCTRRMNNDKYLGHCWPTMNPDYQIENSGPRLVLLSHVVDCTRAAVGWVETWAIQKLINKMVRKNIYERKPSKVLFVCRRQSENNVCTTDEEMENLHLHMRLHGLMQSQSPYFHSPILLAMCSSQFTWGRSRMQWWLSEACIDFSTDGGRSFISCTVWWDEDISHFADPFPAGNCLYF